MRWITDSPRSDRIGMTTVEHALPVPTLYEDVLTLFALSGTGSTPTHVVNYGGAWGEQYVWAHEDVPNDPKYVASDRLFVLWLTSGLLLQTPKIHEA